MADTTMTEAPKKKAVRLNDSERKVIAAAKLAVKSAGTKLAMLVEKQRKTALKRNDRESKLRKQLLALKAKHAPIKKVKVPRGEKQPKVAKLTSAYLAFVHSNRASIVDKLKAETPGDAKVPLKAISTALATAWRNIPDTARKQYVDQSAAYIAIHGKPTKSGLPKGWSVETINGKTMYVHTDGTATVKKPLSAERLKQKLSGVKRPLGAYAQFVKANFKALGGMAQCAVAWKAQKAKAAK